MKISSVLDGSLNGIFNLYQFFMIKKIKESPEGLRLGSQNEVQNKYHFIHMFLGAFSLSQSNIY